MKNKTLLLLLVFALVMTAFFSACTTETETVTTTKTATETKTEQVITLKFGSIYSEPHPYAEADAEWIEKIESETNGRVKIEYYPGATLVSRAECYQECVAGICDITYGEVGIQPAGFDIHRLTEPWMYETTDYMDRMRLWLDLVDKYPEIWDEFNETKTLGLSLGVVYQMVTTKPVRKPEDVAGMSFKAMGSFGDWINKMGGEGMPVPMGEAYTSLQKGILDGVLAPYETFKTFSFGEVAPYCTVVNVAGTVYPGRVMNLDTYNSLPADIQKVFDDNFEWYSETIGRYIYERDEAGLATADEMGVEFIELSSEVLAEFLKPLDEVCIETAEELDAKGYRGTEMYAEVRSLAAKYK